MIHGFIHPICYTCRSNKLNSTHFLLSCGVSMHDEKRLESCNVLFMSHDKKVWNKVMLWVPDVGCQIRRQPEGLSCSKPRCKAPCSSSRTSQQKACWESYVEKLQSSAKLVLWYWYLLYESQKHHKTRDTVTMPYRLTNAKLSCCREKCCILSFKHV